MDIQDTLLKPEEILADIVRGEAPSAKDHVMATMANILIDDQPYLAAQAAQLLLPALLDAAGKDLRTDLGPLELGGLITAMGTTRLETQRLGGRPFMSDGISYWEADWSSPGSDQLSADRERDRTLY